MGGSAPSPSRSTTTTSAPSWLLPYQQGFLGNVNQYVNQDLAGYPPALNYNVAGFDPYQSAAYGVGGPSYGAVLSGLGGVNAGAQNAANLGTAGALSLASGQPVGQFGQTLQAFNTGQLMPGGIGALQNAPQAANQADLANIAGGGMLGPNPYLNQYYNQAAQQLGNQFRLNTMPSLMAQFQQAGAFNSPGFNQAQALAQNQFGNSLATLGANIYEPAYQQGAANQLSAAQSIQGNIANNAALRLQGLQAALGGQEFGLGQQAQASQFGSNLGLEGLSLLPQMTQNQYAPLQNALGLSSGALSGIYGLGSAQQQQQQNQLNAYRANAGQMVNYPFQILSQLGGALGQAALGGGQTASTSYPGSGGGGGGLFGK